MMLKNPFPCLTLHNSATILAILDFIWSGIHFVAAIQSTSNLNSSHFLPVLAPWLSLFLAVALLAILQFDKSSFYGLWVLAAFPCVIYEWVVLFQLFENQLETWLRLVHLIFKLYEIIIIFILFWEECGAVDNQSDLVASSSQDIENGG